MFNMVDNFTMDNVDRKSEFLQAVNEGEPHEIKNKILPSGRPPESMLDTSSLRIWATPCSPPPSPHRAPCSPPPSPHRAPCSPPPSPHRAPGSSNPRQVLRRECEDVSLTQSSPSARTVVQVLLRRKQRDHQRQVMTGQQPIFDDWSQPTSSYFKRPHCECAPCSVPLFPCSEAK